MTPRARRGAWLTVTFLVVEGCPAPRLPEGPPPEYEVPRVSPWPPDAATAQPSAPNPPRPVEVGAGAGDAGAADGAAH